MTTTHKTLTQIDINSTKPHLPPSNPITYTIILSFYTEPFDFELPKYSHPVIFGKITNTYHTITTTLSYNTLLDYIKTNVLPNYPSHYTLIRFETIQPFFHHWIVYLPLKHLNRPITDLHQPFDITLPPK